jgi:hypothetical protein
MPRARLPLGLMILATALAALGATACFSPRAPACAFSCATDGTCPPSYVCQSDNLCHRQDGAGTCLLNPVDGGDGAGPD